jgi:VIT1/CCC1 family predicted Fe2+/Mn2+ transporter
MVEGLNTALLVSVVLTLTAPLLFGYVKGRFTGLNPFKSGVQTILVDGLAAGVAFTPARLIS